MNKKKILVTGANGYIGKHVIEKCIKYGHEVLALDLNDFNIPKSDSIHYCEGSIFDQKSDNQIFAFEPDIVIHLAWINGFQHNSLSHIEDINKHYDFLSRMIDHGIKRICVLGTMHEIGYYEGLINENTPCNPRSYYGIAKNTLRQALMVKQSLTDFSLYWLRGFYLTGDDQNNHSIFAKMLKAEKEGQKEFPLNSGKSKYDFVDIDLFSEMIVKTVRQDKYKGIINLCTGNPVSLKEKVEDFKRNNKLSIVLKYGEYPDRVYDSPLIYGDNTIINKILSESEE